MLDLQHHFDWLSVRISFYLIEPCFLHGLCYILHGAVQNASHLFPDVTGDVLSGLTAGGLRGTGKGFGIPLL